MDRLKKRQPLWKEALILLPITIAVDAVFNLAGFKAVVENPFALLELLLIGWVETLLFIASVRFLFDHFVNPSTDPPISN